MILRFISSLSKLLFYSTCTSPSHCLGACLTLSSKMAKMTFSSEISCAVVAKICQDVGWHTAHKGALTVLADLLENYIRKISSIAVDFANHNDRNDPNVDDLAMTFKFINFDLNQLRDYVLNVNSSPLPQKVPIFPLPCRENRAIDNCAPSDEERPEWFVDNRGDLVYFWSY